MCCGETVREGFERTERNTESNCALFGPMPGGRWHTQNEPEPRVSRASRKSKRPTGDGRALGIGGDEEDRTPDLRIANATLSQLSYVPT